MTSFTRSRGTSFIVAIAVPSFCTARASSCFRSAAASCSPSDISRMAAFLGAGNGGFGHGDQPSAATQSFTTAAARFRILADEIAGCGDLLLDALTGGAAERHAIPGEVTDCAARGGGRAH